MKNTLKNYFWPVISFLIMILWTWWLVIFCSKEVHIERHVKVDGFIQEWWKLTTVLLLCFSADVGGSMGLFLGCSLLTLCEFVDLIVIVCLRCWRKRRVVEINRDNWMLLSGKNCDVRNVHFSVVNGVKSLSLQGKSEATFSHRALFNITRSKEKLVMNYHYKGFKLVRQKRSSQKRVQMNWVSWREERNRHSISIIIASMGKEQHQETTHQGVREGKFNPAGTHCSMILKKQSPLHQPTLHNPAFKSDKKMIVLQQELQCLE